MVMGVQRRVEVNGNESILGKRHPRGRKAHRGSNVTPVAVQTLGKPVDVDGLLSEIHHIQQIGKSARKVGLESRGTPQASTNRRKRQQSQW